MDALTNEHYIDDAWEQLESKPSITDSDILAFRSYFIWVRLATMKRIVRMSITPSNQDLDFLHEKSLDPHVLSNVLACCYGHYLELSQFILDLDDAQPGRAYAGLWQSNCTDSDYWIPEECAFY